MYEACITCIYIILCQPYCWILSAKPTSLGSGRSPRSWRYCWPHRSRCYMPWPIVFTMTCTLTWHFEMVNSMESTWRGTLNMFKSTCVQKMFFISYHSLTTKLHMDTMYVYISTATLRPKSWPSNSPRRHVVSTLGQLHGMVLGGTATWKGTSKLEPHPILGIIWIIYKNRLMYAWSTICIY